eukprot:TRINITY_DN12513_c0_g1_i1.p1 TRINITY_DN12513_c0_g1~~TRINITY_DN12513_c0_g1_i1.p1  ORF type:complete len:224 (+),score=70.57 TRINITY_DN12513_c0_g1_i1:67-738(+)
MTKVLIFGAGTLGGALAKKLAARGGVSVVTATRSGAGGLSADIGDLASLRRLDEAVPGGVDHVVVCCGASTFGPISGMTSEQWEASTGKFVSVTRLCVMLAGGEELGLLRAGGSITVTAGQSARTVNKMWPGMAANNAGLEAFVRCAGVDPPRGCRINAVSPALVRETAVRAGLPTEGTVPADDVADAYVSALLGDGSGQVVDAGSQRTFSKSHQTAAAKQEE